MKTVFSTNIFFCLFLNESYQHNYHRCFMYFISGKTDDRITILTSSYWCPKVARLNTRGAGLRTEASLSLSGGWRYGLPWFYFHKGWMNSIRKKSWHGERLQNYGQPSGILAVTWFSVKQSHSLPVNCT